MTFELYFISDICWYEQNCMCLKWNTDIWNIFYLRYLLIWAKLHVLKVMVGRDLQLWLPLESEAATPGSQVNRRHSQIKPEWNLTWKWKFHENIPSQHFIFCWLAPSFWTSLFNKILKIEIDITLYSILGSNQDGIWLGNGNSKSTERCILLISNI